VNVLAAFVQPPTDLVAHRGAEAFFCGLMGAVVLAAVIWAIKKREGVLVVLVVAAAVSSLIEPFYDYASGAWWATNLTSSFESFDGRIYNPYFFPLGYAVWIGLGTYVAYRIFRRAPSRNRILLMFGVLALGEPVLELPWLGTDLFSYYGTQPYRVFGYSLVWCAINASGLAFTGALLLTLRPRLTGKRILWAAALPFADIGWYFACAWPMWFAMQADASKLVLWATGTVSIAAACGMTYVLATFVSSRSVGAPEPDSDPFAPAAESRVLAGASR
jgi:hypothetical protein